MAFNEFIMSHKISRKQLEEEWRSYNFYNDPSIEQYDLLTEASALMMSY